MCHGTLVDENGSIVEEHHGYVPQVGCFSDGEDYLYFDIDNETGVIKNWEPISTFRKSSDQ
jgi:hypothetical protein